VPVCALLFGLSGPFGWLLLTVALGLLGLGAIMTFYAAITVNLRAREALLPILAFPVLVPLVLACVRATTLLGDPGSAPGEWGSWLSFLALYDLATVIVTTLLFPFAVEG
jgi:heme exporter protein B